MATKRVPEIAKERGMSSKDVLLKLRAAGMDVTAAAAEVDEAEALRALAANGSPRPGAPPPAPGRPAPPAAGPPRPAAPAPAAPPPATAARPGAASARPGGAAAAGPAVRRPAAGA